MQRTGSRRFPSTLAPVSSRFFLRVLGDVALSIPILLRPRTRRTPQPHRRKLQVAITIALLATSWSALLAQGIELPEAEAGPARLTPSLANVTTGVDTNLFNSSENRESDFFVSIRPQLDVTTGYLPIRLTATVGANLDYFASNSAERALNPDVQGRIEGNLNRINLYAAASYRNTRQRPDAAQGIIDLDARARRVVFTPEVGLGIQVSPRVFGQLAFRRTQLEFDADEVFDNTRLAETLNSNRDAVSAAVNYAVTPITSAFLLVEATTNRFPLSPIRDSDSLSVSSGITFSPLARISGRALAGYEWFDPNSDTVPEFTGLVANVVMSYTLSASTTVEFSGSRGPGFSYSAREAYYVWEALRAGVTQRLSTRISLAFHSGRRWFDYQSQTPQIDVASFESRADSTRDDAVYVDYRLTGGTRLRFGLGYRTRESNVNNANAWDGWLIQTSIDRSF